MEVYYILIRVAPLLPLTSIRNIGILFGYAFFFFLTYVVAAEYARPPDNKGEVLVFRRGNVPRSLKPSSSTDVELQLQERDVMKETSPSPARCETPQLEHLSPSKCGKPIFHWEDICYDIDVKEGQRRILDHVDGWVQPGVTTVLMVRNAHKKRPSVNQF